jgi:hypothetical protein
VTEGTLPLRTLVVAAPGGRPTSVMLGNRSIAHRSRAQGADLSIEFAEGVTIAAGQEALITV